MFIKIKETRINTDHITNYGMYTEGDLYIQIEHSDTFYLTSKEADVEKTLLQLDRILNPKHIDIFEVKK